MRVNPEYISYFRNNKTLVPEVVGSSGVIRVIATLCGYITQSHIVAYEIIYSNHNMCCRLIKSY